MATTKRKTKATRRARPNPAPGVVIDPTAAYVKLPIDAATVEAIGAAHERVRGLADQALLVVGALEELRRHLTRRGR